MKPGDIVLVRFPFTDLKKSKQRPALVIFQTQYSPKLQLVGIAMVTSQIEQRHISGDIELKNWKEAGLLHPSLLRLSKVASIEGELCIKKIGKLGESDFKQVSTGLKKMLNSWIEL